MQAITPTHRVLPSQAQKLTLQLYRSINYSPIANARYNQLNEMWKRLVVTSQIDQHHYRLVHLGLAQVINSCDSGADPGQEMPAILAPMISKGMDVLSNKSPLYGARSSQAKKKGIKVKVPKTCNSCGQAGHNKRTCNMKG